MSENMVERTNNKKLTYSEAMDYLKQAAALGWQQGTERAHLRDAYRVIVASRVRSERIAAGMTQEEVSAKINTNALTYRGYENCKSDIPIFYLVRIADVFDVSLDYLTGRTETRTRHQNQDDLDERIRKLEQALVQLDI